MKVSIITVCKNSGATIKNTIESVACSNLDIEYIIIDGASTDGTAEIINKYTDKINVFVSEEDRGISDAFNKGISLATGDIVGLINADDRLLPGALERVLAVFRNDSAVEVVHGDILLYRNICFVKRVSPPRCWWFPWRLVLFNHPATFVKKSVYSKYGMYSLSYKIAMDIDIFLRWVASGVKIYHLSEPLVAMSYGGVSDKHPFAGYRESRRAFLENGYPWIIVYLHYYCKLLLHCIGRAQAAMLMWLRN